MKKLLCVLCLSVLFIQGCTEVTVFGYRLNPPKENYGGKVGEVKAANRHADQSALDPTLNDYDTWKKKKDGVVDKKEDSDLAEYEEFLEWKKRKESEK